MAIEVFQTSLLKNQANNWIQVMVKACKVFQTSLLDNLRKAFDAVHGKGV
jgi:hypothetical protein